MTRISNRGVIGQLPASMPATLRSKSPTLSLSAITGSISRTVRNKSRTDTRATRRAEHTASAAMWDRYEPFLLKLNNAETNLFEGRAQSASSLSSVGRIVVSSGGQENQLYQFVTKDPIATATRLGWWDGHRWVACFGEGMWSPEHVSSIRPVEVTPTTEADVTPNSRPRDSRMSRA